MAMVIGLRLQGADGDGEWTATARSRWRWRWLVDCDCKEQMAIESIGPRVTARADLVIMSGLRLQGADSGVDCDCEEQMATGRERTVGARANLAMTRSTCDNS